jgi:hypothetical protein
MLPVTILAAAAVALAAPAQLDPVHAQQWVALDVAHLSRTLPAFDRMVETPLNPTLQLSYHRNVFGETLGAGFAFQTSVASFDQLFWSLALGTGIESTYRPSFGLFAQLGLRLDYVRAFTGSNNFVHERGEYRQETSAGRGFLRVSPLDVALGYAPPALHRLDIIPALRFTWMLDLPLYENDGANPWSYTSLGVSVLWSWEKRQ